jgi:hypothetical protein
MMILRHCSDDEIKAILEDDLLRWKVLVAVSVGLHADDSGGRVDVQIRVQPPPEPSSKLVPHDRRTLL